MMRCAIFVLTAACLLQPFGAAVGQSPSVSEAQKALEKDVAGKGLTLIQPIKIDSIGEDEYMDFVFDVQADVDLVIQAACNSICSDVDLEVFTSAGAALGEDKGGNATPQVTLAAGHHPTRIEVMAQLMSCGEETCGIAVGVYKQ
jgi:hypothetical protein